MTNSRREKILEVTRTEIKETARQLMVEKGTAGISIRAIARKMDMTAPALYHYFSNLDDLITALIHDGFAHLADTLEKAVSDSSLKTSAERLMALAHANRNWALEHPIDYQLLYGNPIPSYDQPTDITYPPARRSFIVTATVFTQAIQNEEIILPVAYRQLPPAIEDSLKKLQQEDGHQLPFAALYLAANAWVKVHGHLMLELFDLIQPVIANTDAYFEYEIQNFIKQVGLK